MGGATGTSLDGGMRGTPAVLTAEEAQKFAACVAEKVTGGMDRYILAPSTPDINQPLVWSPSLVKNFSEINISKCQLGGEEATDYQKILGLYIQSIFIPVLCLYQNDPDQFQYALFIFNQIVEKLCRSAFLEPVAGTPDSHYPPYSQTLGLYFKKPDPGNIFPVERMNVTRFDGGLSTVDPFAFTDQSVVAGALDIWENPPSSSTSDDMITAARENFEGQALAWSLYVYDHSLVSPPREPLSPDGDLPLELGWDLPHPYTRWDEKTLYETLVAYPGRGLKIPSNAVDILNQFQLGLKDLEERLSALSLSPASQLFGAEAVSGNSDTDSSIDYYPSLKAGNHTPMNPRGSKLNEWGLDGVVRVRDEFNQNAYTILSNQFLESKAWVDLENDFEKKWEEIKKEFSAYYELSQNWQDQISKWKEEEGDAYDTRAADKALTNFLNSVFNQLYKECYNTWAQGTKAGVVGNIPISVLFAKVDGGLEYIESRIAQDPNGGEELRYLLSLILDGITDVLSSHQRSINQQAELLRKNPDTAILGEQILLHYEWAHSYFRVMSSSHGTFSNNSSGDSSPAYVLPYVNYTLDEAGKIGSVLSEAKNVVRSAPLDLRSSLATWSAYSEMGTQIRTADPNHYFDTALFSFLNMESTAPEFYVALSSAVQGTNLSYLKNVQQALLSGEEALGKEATSHLSPPQAFRLMNRLRYASYLFAYYIKLFETYAERETIDLGVLVSSDLDLWFENLPLGWPKPDGCTEEKEQLSPMCSEGGFKGDFSFFPDESCHLSKEEFMSLLSLDSEASEEEALTRLIAFIGDFDRGYYKFFSYGGDEKNVKGEKIGYVKEHVALNQLLLVLEDIYLAAEIRLIKNPNDEKAKRLHGVAQGLAYHLDDLLHSPKVDDSFHALIDYKDGVYVYTGIAPSSVYHQRDPELDYGDFKQDLAVDSILWKAGHQSKALLEVATLKLEIASKAKPKAQSKEELPSNDFLLFEERLKALPLPSPFETVDWYLRKGYSAENEYLYGRLLEVAEGKPLEERKERYANLKNAFEKTSLALLKEVPDLLKSGEVKDKQFFVDRNFPEPTAKLLASLTPAEVIWVTGFVRSKIALSDRYYKMNETDDVYFEELRQAEVDSLIFSMNTEEAKVALARIEGYTGLSSYDGSLDHQKARAVVAGLDRFFNDSAILVDRKQTDILYLLLNDNYEGYSFSKVEILYLTSLVSSAVNGVPSQENLNNLGVDLTAVYGKEFDRDKVQTFYNQIPDSERPLIYRYLYKLSFGSYQGFVSTYIGVGGNSSILLDPQGLNGNGNKFWGWLGEEIKGQKEKNLGFRFNPDEFNLAELPRIRWAWEQNSLSPRFPKRADADSVARFLNRVIEDERFFEKNKTSLSPFLSPEDKALIEQDGLSSEDVVRLNLSLLSGLDPVLSSQTRDRKKLVAAVDEVLASDFGDEKRDGSIVLDVPTQLVLDEVFDRLKKAGLDITKNQFVDEMRDILTGPFDATDPLQKGLYSIYNPNRRSLEKGPPKELTLVYSPNYFSVQSLIDDPYLLKDIQKILNDMLQVVTGIISEDELETIAQTRWTNKEAVRAILENNYYRQKTLDYYEYYDFNKVEEIKNRLDHISQVLESRL